MDWKSFDEIIVLLRNRQFKQIYFRILNRINRSKFAIFFYYDSFFILRCDFDKVYLDHKVRFVSTRLASFKDLPEISKLANQGNELAERLRKGHQCVLAEINNTIVGMEWIEFTETHYEEIERYLFKLPIDGIWLFDAYIKPEFRLRGIWVNLKLAIIKSLARGKTSAFCLVYEQNEHSLKTHLRFGFKKEKSVRHLRFFGKDVYFEYSFKK